MNNNCYDNKIKQILQEGEKCKGTQIIIGPAGPRGEAASIIVGTTTTSAPGTDASVVNAGTAQNAVLNFTIPRGEQGEEGPAAQITSAYGRRFNTSTDTIELIADTPATIPLNTLGPVENVNGETENQLLVEETGIYLIEYYFSLSSSAEATINVSVKQNESPIGSSTITKSLQADTNTDFYGSTINTLNAADTIELVIQSSAEATITPAGGTNAYLNIIKIV